MADFEVFSRALSPLKRDPTLTIQKNGVLSLNKPAWLLLGSPAAVEMLYDRVGRTVGVRGVDPGVGHACAVRTVAGPNSAPFLISARAFLRHYGIEQPVSRRWTGYLDDGVLCVDLASESLAVTSNRARRAVPGDEGGHGTAGVEMF